MELKHFCNCHDFACKNHPQNHGQGCDPCIKKNLQAKEIPACFFKLIKEDLSELEEFHLADFVELYLKNNKN